MNTAHKILYWTPRILAILAILFLIMFSFDAFEGDDSFGRKLLGFLVHNIPAFILVVALAVAWNHEIIGGVIFIAASIAMAILFRSFAGNAGSLMIISPFFLAGLLFILQKVIPWRRK